MKNTFLVLLLCAPVLVAGQTIPDSTAIRQVDSLLKISRDFTAKNNFDQALEINAAAEKIALEKLGRVSVAYSNCCHLHGIIMYYSADYPEAEKWWLETKAIRERVLGKEHPAYEKSLTNLAILYVDMGKFSLAESCYLEARVIREKMVGKEHPDYAQNLNSLAILYWYMGDFETAEPLYLEARYIREKVLGKEHPEYAKSQNNLAILYRDMGRYETADRSLPQRGDNWNYLPGTEKEVTDIGALLEKTRFSSGIYLGKKATEEAFNAVGASDIPSPRVLHIATHGFFFPDPELNPQSVIRNPQFDEPVFKRSDHPMIRSGLILAGGNHAWATGKPIKPGLEDGILTAYEISQMNLSNTELVVLSACETGLGDIQSNEGVYGLQRAFKIAGAKYLIMSLWQVPDKQTSLLMTTFYKKWLEEKMTIPEAFRAAQRELREAGLDPYYWAGFVLVE